MELTAAISALEMLDDRETAVVYSDSQYLVNGITKWVKTWQKNNWITSTKSRVQNVDLWERLVVLRDKHQAIFFLKGLRLPG
jgi:ribonuclease HI